MSSCCKQGFSTRLPIAHERNNLKLPDCTVYLPCWVLVKGWSEKPGAFRCWVLPRNVSSLLSHAIALGGGEVIACLPNVSKPLSVSPSSRTTDTFAKFTLVLLVTKLLTQAGTLGEKGKFLFSYFYKIKFQGDFKSQALNLRFKDKMLKERSWRGWCAGDQQGKLSPEVCAAQFCVLKCEKKIF